MLFYFWIREEMGRGDLRRLVKAGKRKALREVRLEDCFEFFGSFFVSVCDTGLTR